MNFWSHDWRDRRTFHNQGISFGAMHHTISNYSTDTNMTKKPDMKEFEEDLFTKIHCIPDPLKKNLADTVITVDNKETMVETPVEEKEFYYEAAMGPTIAETIPNTQRRDFYPSLTGITSFISNVFGTISGAMFQRRPKSPVSQYYDCFDSDSCIAHEMASDCWQISNVVDQNKKRALEQSSAANDDMSNCRATVAQVEDKISAVRDLLQNKTVPNVPRTPRVRYRRPKREFIEPGSVKNSYIEEPTADSYVSLSDDDYIEYVAIPNNQNEQFCDIEAPRMKVEFGIVPESTDIVNTLPDITPKVQISTPTVINNIEFGENAKNKDIPSVNSEETVKKEVIVSTVDSVATPSVNIDSKKAKKEVADVKSKVQIQKPVIVHLGNKPVKLTDYVQSEKKVKSLVFSAESKADMKKEIIVPNVDKVAIVAANIDSEKSKRDFAAGNESKVETMKVVSTPSEVKVAKVTTQIHPENSKKQVADIGSKDKIKKDIITPDNTAKVSANTQPEKTKVPEVVSTVNNNNSSSENKVVTLTNNIEEQTETIANAAPDVEVKKEIIASCEDKLAKLKAMLLEKRRKPSKTAEIVEPLPEPIKDSHQKPITPSKVIPIEKKHDKRFKNPHRLTDKRRKTKLRKNIQDDLIFANELDSEEISSVENSPAIKPTMRRVPETAPIKSVDSDTDYFNEIKGRFHSASDSDDSFQIVFTDSPKCSRMRRPSDCDSEDSFIVFEDSPDACFTSNHLFNQTSDESDIDESDAESDVSDSGCAVDVCKLSHSLSRTVSDLTDTSLFDDSKPLEDTSVVGEIENDEVDCSVRTVGDMLGKELSPVKEESPEVESDSESVKHGLLINEARKLKRKSLPPKTVTFSEKPPKVHVMRVWSFAARQARAGHWERYSLDRERFKRRIADVDMAISWVLKPQHRNRVMFQRFMPWWNKQKRIEAAERKQREAEEKARLEEERIKKEREAIIEDDVAKEIEEINNYDESIELYIKDLIEKDVAAKKEKAIVDLKNFLNQDKKKIARKKERDRKIESEMNKLSQKETVANGIVPLKC